MKNVFLSLIFVGVFLPTKGATFTVTTTADYWNEPIVPNSLRWATQMCAFNPGHDIIEFNIPGAGPHTITLKENLKQFGDGDVPGVVSADWGPGIGNGGSVLIDGWSQPGASPGNPRIHIQTLVGQGNDVFQFVQDDLYNGRDASGSEVRGIYFGPVVSFPISILGADDILVQDCYIGFLPDGDVGTISQKGITITGNNGQPATNVGLVCRNITVRDCYISSALQMAVDAASCDNLLIENCIIGTDLSGNASPVGYGNGNSGIFMGDVRNSLIQNNFICNSGRANINDPARSEDGIEMWNCYDNEIVNNVVGVGTGGIPLGCGPDGLAIHGGSTNNFFRNNVIAYSDVHGISMFGGANANYFYNNEIYENGDNGMDLREDGTEHNIIGVNAVGIGEPNEIYNNDGDGVTIYGPAHKNTIRENAIYCNGDKAIDLDYAATNGNDGYPYPVIDRTVSTETQIIGVPNVAHANAIIDIYMMSNCTECADDGTTQGDGLMYLGQTIANGAGAWTYNGLLQGNVAAKATEGTGPDNERNSSEYSTCMFTIEPCADITPPNAGDDLTLCANDTVLNADPVTDPGRFGTWTVISGTVTIEDPLDPNSAISDLVNGTTVTIRWTVGGDACPEDHDDVIIVVEELPTIPEAGEDRSVCISDGNFSLQGNTALIGIGTWTHNGGGVLSNDNDPNATYTIDPSDTMVTFIWSIASTSGSCPGTSDTVVITVDPEPGPAIAGDPETYCITSQPFNLAATAPANGTGQWSGPGTISTTDLLSPQVSDLELGIHTFTWSVSNEGLCPDVTDQVQITMEAGPDSANAVDDMTVCLADPVSVSANNPLNGTGIWSYGPATTGGTIDNLTDPNSSVSGMDDGDVLVAIWTINTNNSCPPSDDTLIITATGTTDPHVNLTVDKPIICEGDNVTFTAIGSTAGDNPQYTFYNLVDGSIMQGPSEVDTLFVPSLNDSITVVVHLLSDSRCLADTPDAYDTLGVQVDQHPSDPNAGLDLTVCTDVAPLNADTPIIGTGIWSVVSGAGTIDDPLSPNTQVTGLDASDAPFLATWVITNGVCPDKTDTVGITKLGDMTSPDAGPGGVFCENVSEISLNANSPNVTAGETAIWTTSGNGTFVDDNDPLTSYTPGTTDLNDGSVVLTWTFSNGVCPEANDTLLLTFDELPDTADAGPDQVVCTDIANLTANIPDPGEGAWSVISGTGTVIPINVPNSQAIGLDENDAPLILRWTISNGVCPDSHDDVEITRVGVITTPNAGSDQVLCESDLPFNLSANAVNTTNNETGIWTTSGSGNFGDASLPNTIYTPSDNDIANDPVVLTWTIANGLCPQASDSLLITIGREPTIADAGANVEQCDNPVQLAANTPVNGTGRWTSSSVVNLSNDTVSNASVSLIGSLPQEVTMTWTISMPDQICPESSADVQIRVTGTQKPQVTLEAVPQPACLGENVTVTASPVFGGNAPTFEWYINNQIQPETGLSITRNDFIDGMQVSVIMLSDLVCADPTAANAQTALEIVTPPAPVLFDDDTVCYGSDVLLTVEGEQMTNVLISWYVDDLPLDENSTTYLIDGSLPGGTGSSGTYHVVAHDLLGVCEAVTSNAVSVLIYGEVGANIVPAASNNEQVIYVDDQLQLNGEVINADQFGWGESEFLSADSVLNPLFMPVGDVSGYHDIMLFASNNNGQCVDTAMIRILVRVPVRIPNVFTPNGDGLNDLFVIKGLETYPDAELKIVNRWGNVVFKSQNASKFWNGNNNRGNSLPVATYYFELDLGEEGNKIFKGEVTLLR